MLDKIKYIFIFITITMLISSCATLNKDECKTANWRTIGYEDGTKGHKASRIGQHRSACAEHGISPDLNLYNQGREQGLKKYCIPTTAYRKGLSGYSYNGVCAGYNEKIFVDAFNYGLTIYKAKRRLNNLKNKYSRELDYISGLEAELHEKEDWLVSGKLSKVKALIILKESKEIAEEIGRAKSNLQILDGEIYDQKQHIIHLKQQYNYH